MKQIIKKLIVYTLNLPHYSILKLIPNDKSLWIRGLGEGEKYANNSRYLYKYRNIDVFVIKGYWQENFDFVKEHSTEVYLERRQNISTTQLKKILRRFSLITKDRLTNLFDIQNRLERKFYKCF